MAAAAARSGFRRRFSSSAFVPPKLRTPHPKADSFPNLFVSGLIKRTTTDGPREAFATFGEVVHASFLKRTRWYMINSNLSSPLTMCNQCRKIFPSLITPPASYSTQASDQNPKERKDLLTIEDPFNAPTYNIPEKPVTFAEGASYSLAILGGLGIAALAGYAVFKELIFEPKEYAFCILLIELKDAKAQFMQLLNLFYNLLWKSSRRNRKKLVNQMLK